MKKASEWIPQLWSNWISTTGLVLATVGGFSLLFGMVYLFAAPTANVYASAFLLLVTPGILLMGLLLIPLGHVIERWRGKELSEPSQSLRAAVADALRHKKLRRHALFVVGLTFLNVVLFATAGQQAVHFMDSPRFCGQTCHVMEPEFTAYSRSPHSRVPCVQCHIGPGASWAVRAKIDGLRQVWAVAAGTVERPIPAPVHALRPARDTCEQCHWPSKFHGNLVKTWMYFEQDEKNSATVNVMNLRVGGENPQTGAFEGIHWHTSARFDIRYEAHDAKRELIGKVSVYDGGTLVREYLPPPPEKDSEEPPLGPVRETRTMDCVDCHNRPTHKFDGPPERALDLALTDGRLDATVPWLKKMALPLLKREDRPRDTAEAEFEKELRAAYEASKEAKAPADDVLKAAAKGLADVYRRNVFPEMKVGWDTYPEHIGHRGESADKRGCWRCHDNKHATADGKKLSRSCGMCHAVLVDEESLSDIDKKLLPLLPPHVARRAAATGGDKKDD